MWITEIQKDEMKKLCKELKEIIESNDNIILWTDVQLGRTYWIHSRDYGVEIRFSLLGDILTISRVCFENKRCGCMTKCYETILKKREGLGIKKIVIQSVLTKEMMNWCLKNGFTPSKDCIAFDDILSGDYILNL